MSDVFKETYPSAMHYRMNGMVRVICSISTETAEHLLIFQNTGRPIRLKRTDVEDIVRRDKESNQVSYHGYIVIPRHIAISEDLDYKEYA